MQTEQDTLSFTIQMLPPNKIAYVRQIGPYGLGNAQAMERIKAWAKSRGLLNDTAVLFGIAWDDPGNTKPEGCRYDACIQLNCPCDTGNDEIATGDLPGGAYAVFLVDHTAEALTLAWAGAFPALAGRGFTIDSTRPALERYQTRLVQQHRCELLIPVLS